MRAAILVFGVVACGALSVVLAQAPAAANGATVWSGVFSDAQAARGQAEYSSHCAGCHREDLSGYGGLLKGDRFMNEYREASLYRLFEKIKTTMPRGAAGSLADRAYVDIVSYLLKVNDFPPGAGELSVDDLQRVQVVAKEGPQPVPEFSLVEVVGCLASVQGPGGWVVTNGTTPVRGAPQAAPAELSSAAAKPLGTSTFELLLYDPHVAEPHRGHKVDVRGFLFKVPTGNRINITSLETVAPECAP